MRERLVYEDGSLYNLDSRGNEIRPLCGRWRYRLRSGRPFFPALAKLRLDRAASDCLVGDLPGA
jgi:hypothetical protein